MVRGGQVGLHSTVHNTAEHGTQVTGHRPRMSRAWTSRTPARPSRSPGGGRTLRPARLPPDRLRCHQPGQRRCHRRDLVDARSASIGPSRRSTTSATWPSAKMTPSAAPASGPPAWPRSAPHLLPGRPGRAGGSTSAPTTGQPTPSHAGRSTCAGCAGTGGTSCGWSPPGHWGQGSLIVQAQDVR